MNDCIFCKIINGEIPSKKVYEDDKVMAFMDVNPKVDGHTLLVPKKHITDFMGLENEDLNHIYGVVKKLTPVLMNAVDAKAFTLGYNYGDSQLVKHFHIHLLPDYGINKTSKDVEEVYKEIEKVEI